MTVVNTAIWYIAVLTIVKRVDPKEFSSQGDHFFLFFLLYLYEMIDGNKAYCGNLSTIYVNQIIMLFTLNFYSDVCQFFSIKQEKNFKWAEDLNRHFFHGRQTDGPQTHEKMHNIINH